MMRYVRAFFKTVQLTIQGRQIQPIDVRYPELTAWMQTGQKLAGEAFQVAEANGWDVQKRESLRLKLDGRETSMDVILGAVRHNFTLEYPMLLEAMIEHNLTTLYALNLNDQYRVNQLAQAEELPQPIGAAVQKLADHLSNIPSSNSAA